MTPSLPPPPRLRIGVTGHRFLAEVDKLTAALDQVSDALARAFPVAVPTDCGSSAQAGTWQVISPLAEGADQLVAHHFLGRGAALLVPLPLPIPDYLEDFRSPESRAAFFALLERAAEVVQLPPAAAREEAYLQVGLYVLAHSDVLVALWDGRPEQGMGGTGGIVELARQKGLPLAWVHTQRSRPGVCAKNKAPGRRRFSKGTGFRIRTSCGVLPNPALLFSIHSHIVTFERFPAPTATVHSSDFSRSPQTEDDDDGQTHN